MIPFDIKTSAGDRLRFGSARELKSWLYSNDKIQLDCAAVEVLKDRSVGLWRNEKREDSEFERLAIANIIKQRFGHDAPPERWRAPRNNPDPFGVKMKRRKHGQIVRSPA
jgi:hypothetical protein